MDTRVALDGTTAMTGPLTLPGPPTQNLQATTKKYVDDGLALKADGATTYTKTQVDTALTTKADTATTYSKTQVDTALLLKKDTGTFDTKIRNANDKTAISCDTDRYISIKSNGTKLADVLEDEVNGGLTINTYNKRYNVVSQQPQTYYHNAGTGLFNFKYTDDGNTTPGQLRLGQIQLAPSNTTNLNPALTLSSSRVNGLGTVGAMYLDSAYGNA